ncbi:MAG: FUSC family protein [Romboutsia sp.]|uniref:FUSC family protein n=1 Tax=Romboutsia sp. TaxID=1965302 RepID=UPI003F336214
MKLEKMGMRTIKTGIAVMLCVILGEFFIQNPFYSAAGCIISMQDTVKGSMKAGMNRVKGTILGGIIGFLIVLINPGGIILSGIGVMATIYACNILKLNKAILVACVTFLSIHLGIIDTNPAQYSFFRVLDTSIGVVIGVLINYIIARPNYLHSTINEFKEIERLTVEFIESKIVNKDSFNIKKLEKEIKRVDSVYSKLVDELDYSRNNVDLEKLENTIDICREIYFHMQSIELLEKKLYLNKENYERIKKLHQSEEIDWDLHESESPVFNYHLSKIIEEIKLLHKINSSNDSKI